jgi:hypothetical protein
MRFGRQNQPSSGAVLGQHPSSTDALLTDMIRTTPGDRLETMIPAGADRQGRNELRTTKEILVRSERIVLGVRDTVGVVRIPGIAPRFTLH